MVRTCVFNLLAELLTDNTRASDQLLLRDRVWPPGPTFSHRLTSAPSRVKKKKQTSSSPTPCEVVITPLSLARLLRERRVDNTISGHHWTRSTAPQPNPPQRPDPYSVANLDAGLAANLSVDPGGYDCPSNAARGPRDPRRGSDPRSRGCATASPLNSMPDFAACAGARSPPPTLSRPTGSGHAPEDISMTTLVSPAYPVSVAALRRERAGARRRGDAARLRRKKRGESATQTRQVTRKRSPHQITSFSRSSRSAPEQAASASRRARAVIDQSPLQKADEQIRPGPRVRPSDRSSATRDHLAADLEKIAEGAPSPRAGSPAYSESHPACSRSGLNLQAVAMNAAERVETCRTLAHRSRSSIRHYLNANNIRSPARCIRAASAAARQRDPSPERRQAIFNVRPTRPGVNSRLANAAVSLERATPAIEQFCARAQAKAAVRTTCRLCEAPRRSIGRLAAPCARSRTAAVRS